MAIKGYWKLDGNANDFSGNGNNGTPVNITFSQANGRLGQGAGFNGTSSYISLGTINMLPAGTGTISVWTKGPLNSGVNNYIIAKGDDNGNGNGTNAWGLDIIPNSSAGKNLIAFLYGTGAWITIELAFDLSIWNHIVVVLRSNATQSIYLNGQLIKSGTSAVKAPYASAGMYIGQTARSAPYSYFYQGASDEIKVDTMEWNVARIKNDYSRIKGFF